MKINLMPYLLSISTLLGYYSCSLDTTNNEKLKGPILTKSIYVFPSAEQIMNDPTVLNAMRDLWEQTKLSASFYSRYEYGFYIYYERKTKFFTTGNVISGPEVHGCIGTNASIKPGVVANNATVCAFFHTHTPLSYCSIGYREVGPSIKDIEFANNNLIPCLLYDYSGNIYGGHDIDAPAKIYTFGVFARSVFE